MREKDTDCRYPGVRLQQRENGVVDNTRTVLQTENIRKGEGETIEIYPKTRNQRNRNMGLLNMRVYKVELKENICVKLSYRWDLHTKEKNILEIKRKIRQEMDKRTTK